MTDKLESRDLRCVYARPDGKVLCQILRKGQSFRATVESVEEGIELRDKIFDFYERNKRLPLDEEIGFVRVIDRRRHSLSEKHITFQPDYNRYVFHMVKDGQSISANFANKEQAVELRDRAIEFYEEHGQLPTLYEIGFDEIKRHKEN